MGIKGLLVVSVVVLEVVLCFYFFGDFVVLVRLLLCWDEVFDDFVECFILLGYWWLLCMV